MKILVTGGTGMLGTAFRKIKTNHDLLLVGSKDFNLTDSRSALSMIRSCEPDAIIHLAAKVGGIKSNLDNMADFYTDNVLINTNVLDAAHKLKIKKVLSLMSTCVYPDKALLPLKESSLHLGPPHPSNFGYAYAKRMLDVQSRAYRKQHGCNFITAIPNNLFGEDDNFDLRNSHVIPAIIRKVYEAKKKKEDVLLWGDGSPLREFTYSRDLAHTLMFVLENYNDSPPINVGNTSEYSIEDIALMISRIISFEGNITWDTTMPNGQLRKPSDNSKLIGLGWNADSYTNIYNSLKKTCEWFINNYPSVRGI